MMLEDLIRIHSVTGKIDDSFIGIKIRNSIVDFYYPETYDLADYITDLKQFRKDVLAILKTIEIAKTLSADKAKIESSFSRNNFAMLSYLWIIKDYLENGFYINREKDLRINQKGKINWKRTIQGQPIVSNGNVIYKDITVEIKQSLDDIIVDIHKLCLKKSIDFIGWLFNIDSKTFYIKPYNSALIYRYIHVLKTEIDKTFDDYKKLRLNHMFKVIEGIDGDNDSNEFVYGVDNYFYIFERMVDSIFGNQKDLRRFNPKANWFLVSDDFKRTPSSELRPDTIFIDQSTKIAYIIDSKYYRYGFTGQIEDLPETTSIQKQITYGDYLKKHFKDYNIKDIRNAFILPYDKHHNVFRTSELIHYIGFSTAEWKDNNEKYESIYAFLVDTKHIISFWNKGNHEKDIEMLIEQIEEAVNKKETLPL